MDPYTPGSASGQSHAAFESQLNSKAFSFAAPPPGSRLGRNAARGNTINALINESNTQSGNSQQRTPSSELPPLLGTHANEAGPSGTSSNGNGGSSAKPGGRQVGGASEFVKKLYKYV